MAAIPKGNLQPGQEAGQGIHLQLGGWAGDGATGTRTEPVAAPGGCPRWPHRPGLSLSTCCLGDRSHHSVTEQDQSPDATHYPSLPLGVPGTAPLAQAPVSPWPTATIPPWRTVLRRASSSFALPFAAAAISPNAHLPRPPPCLGTPPPPPHRAAGSCTDAVPRGLGAWPP